jgi:dienelactone hydrolase
MRALFFLLACLQLNAQRNPLQERIVALMGGLPTEKSPLNAQITGGFEREGYRVEHVIFESLPGFKVTANLYLPASGRAPLPAVLGTAGHSDVGKAADTYQSAWISLARRGYVVLAYDPPGQGERFEFMDKASGKPLIRSGVPQHIQAGMQCLLTGTSIARYFVWDGVRALDYLLTRKEVDPKRIAVAGNSGGGTQAALLAAAEPRLAAVVSSCYTTTWGMLIEKPGPQDMEQVLPGFLAAGFDFVDYIRAFSKPYLISSAIRDYFPIDGARRTFQLAKSEGLPVEMVENDQEHGWTKELRQGAYRFLDKHLLGLDRDATEGALTLEKPATLNVTPTGQLATSIDSETVSSLNAARARQLHASRRAARGGDLNEIVSTRLGITWKPLAPKSGDPVPLAIEWPESLRFPPAKSGYSAEYQAAARAWLHDDSLLKRQVLFLLEQAAKSPSPVTLRASGADAPAALIAALLDPRIARVVEENGFPSWLAATQDPMFTLPPALVVFGVLADFDLPDIRKALGSRLTASARP